MSLLIACCHERKIDYEESDGVVATLGLERYAGIVDSIIGIMIIRAGSAFPFLDDGEAGDSNVFGILLSRRSLVCWKVLTVLSYAMVRDLPSIMIGPTLDETAGIPANMDLGSMDVWEQIFLTNRQPVVISMISTISSR